jgi:hypothetical protein
VNHPKIVYGMSTHRYLDTMLYPCRSCRSSFTGYHPESMKHDSGKVMCLFNIHLSGRFAVDEDAFSFIIACWRLPSDQIHTIMKDMATEKYLNDYALYLHMVREKRIKLQRPNTAGSDPRQRTLHATVEDATSKLSPNQRLMARLKTELRGKRLALELAKGRMEDNICFRALLRVKNSRNTRNAGLFGLGKGKLQALMNVGIMNGRQLLEYPGIPDAWNGSKEKRELFESWRGRISQILDDRNEDIAKLASDVTNLETEISVVEGNVHLEMSVEDRMEEEGEINTPVAEQVPKFSAINDKSGYNVRVLSSGRIDCILMTDFLNRKPLQQSKMIGQSSQVLKMDASMKLPKKIHVYQGVGRCFRPYQHMVTVQNENNQTVYYKVCSGAEAIDAVEDGLKALSERNPNIKVIYVDNCCKVRNKLKEIFPNAVILLDPFHWMKRFDGLLNDSKSEEALLFRMLLTRALFVTDSAEYERAKAVAKQRLERSGRNNDPTHRQIMAEARTVIPPKEILESNVLAVIKYVLMQDLAIELRKATRNAEERSPLPKPFFKPMSRTLRNELNTLIGHIRSGCLSDVPGVSLHKMNPTTGKIFCCRGTNSNKNDNLYLRLLCGKHLGIARADRLISTYLEVSNDQKRVSRLGEGSEASNITYRTERLAMINSLHVEAGFKEDEPPFVMSHPAVPPEIQYDIGFDKAVKLPTGESVLDILEANDAARVSVNEYVDETVLEAGLLENSSEEDAIELVEEVADDGDHVDPPTLERRVVELLPEIRRSETTMEAYERLTNKQPWIPFNSGNCTMTEVDRAEVDLFEEMRCDYSLSAPLRAPNGLNSFKVAWNLKVAERYKEKIETGDETIVLINRKNVDYLRDHWQRVNSRNATGQRVEPTNQGETSELERMNETLRSNRRNVSVPPLQQATPIHYAQDGQMPVGRPMILNTNIVAHGLVPASNNARIAPWRIPLQTNAAPINPLTNFRRRTWCITCGFQKAEHTKEERFGKPCCRDYCGKCHQRKEFHSDNGFRMGPFCNKMPHPIGSKHHFWYN